jgi:type I restriction-modification system DNA methylase subunit
MNQQDIKNLEKELWDAADDLRSNSKLTAGEYKDPLLGLVLLRFAQNRYECLQAGLHPQNGWGSACIVHSLPLERSKEIGRSLV